MSIPKPFIDRLNTKEKRLFEYLADESNSRILGDILKACHTTLNTYFKTKESMMKKYDEYKREYNDWCEWLGIEP